MKSLKTIAVFGTLCIFILLPKYTLADLSPEAQKGVATATSTLDQDIHRLALKYDQDEALARRIMACESTMYHGAVNENKDKDGKVWSRDFGRWQINDFFHAKTASAMGLNIHDPADNLEYGFWLMSKQGTKPWYSSKKCWRVVE